MQINPAEFKLLVVDDVQTNVPKDEKKKDDTTHSA